MTRNAVEVDATSPNSLLIAQRAEVGQAVAAVGQHHRQIANDMPEVMPRPSLLEIAEAQRQRLGQPGLIATRASGALVEKLTAKVAAQDERFED